MRYLLISVIGLFLFSCKSNNPVENSSKKLTQVKFLGYDTRKCGWCGGLKLSFDLNANLEQDSFYLVNYIVPNNVITDSTKFPLQVGVDWKYNDTICCRKVDIFKIEK